MLKDDQDGIDIAKAIRVRSPQLKVIFITGMAQEIVELKAEQVPGSQIVIKPIDLEDILSKLAAT